MFKGAKIILLSLFLLAVILSLSFAISSSDFTNVGPSNSSANSSTNSTQGFVFKYINDTNITASCTLYLGSTAVGVNATTRNGTNTRIYSNTSLGSDGRKTWYVGCTNGTTANSPTWEFILDTAAPTGVTLLAPADGLNTTNATVTFTAYATDAIGDYYSAGKNMKYNVTANGDQNKSVRAVGNGSQFSFTETYTDGAWQVNVTAYDNASNSATSSTVTFRVDTTAPALAGYVVNNVSGGVNMSARVNFTSIDANLPVHTAYAYVYSNGTKTLVTGTLTQNTTGQSIMNQLDIYPASVPFDGYFIIEPGANDTNGNTRIGTNQTNWTKMTLLASKWTLIQVDRNQSLINVSNYSTAISKVAWYNTSSNAFQTFTVGAASNSLINVVDGDSVYVYTTADAGLMRKWSVDFATKRNISLASGWNFIGAMNQSIQMWQLCDWTLDNASAALKTVAVFDTATQVYKSQVCSIATGNNNNLTVVRGRGIAIRVNTTTTMGLYR